PIHSRWASATANLRAAVSGCFAAVGWKMNRSLAIQPRMMEALRLVRLGLRTRAKSQNAQYYFGYACRTTRGASKNRLALLLGQKLPSGSAVSGLLARLCC